MKVDCDSNITKEKGLWEHKTEVREYNYNLMLSYINHGIFFNDWRYEIFACSSLSAIKDYLR